MANQYKEFRVSNDAMDDPEELQRRIQDEGYLFFKKLQDPDKLLALRREMLTVIQEGGWLVAGTDPMDGIADISRQCTEGNSEYTDVYHEVYKLESFHRSGHWPEVIDTLEKVIGKPVLPIRRKLPVYGSRNIRNIPRRYIKILSISKETFRPTPAGHLSVIVQ